MPAIRRAALISGATRFVIFRTLEEHAPQMPSASQEVVRAGRSQREAGSRGREIYEILDRKRTHYVTMYAVVVPKDTIWSEFSCWPRVRS